MRRFEAESRRLWQSRRFIDVLYRIGNPMQKTAMTTRGHLPISFARRFERALGGHRYEAVWRTIMPFYSIEAGLGEL
jgi:hypothetical protein